MSKNWIAVASHDHVKRGKQEGFMQVNHGKLAPLKRIHPNDFVIYYSPVEIFKTREPLQAFTAFGRVKDVEPYMGDMGGGFTPFRRDVNWLDTTVAPIRPLLERLEFSQGNKNWGYQMRFGLFEISDHDRSIIANAMNITFK